LFSFKMYNDEFDNIVKMGMIIINNWSHCWCVWCDR
jgi:hypothetical protein